MAGKKHVHKYHKIDMNGVKVWACALGCGHYMPKHMEQLVINRKSICWKCGLEFELNALNMQHDKPKCEECDSEAHELINLIEHGFPK